VDGDEVDRGRDRRGDEDERRGRTPEAGRPVGDLGVEQGEAGDREDRGRERDRREELAGDALPDGSGESQAPRG
jgi:hypothetical protein